MINFLGYLKAHCKINKSILIKFNYSLDVDGDYAGSAIISAI